MLFRKEYYKSPYYFFLKEGKNDLTLYYSVSETLTEARKKDESMKFDKKSKSNIEKELTKIFQDKKLKDTESVTKKLKKMKSEIEEFVDYDGTFLSSKIPIYNPKIAPKGTTDQEVVQNRQTINPLTRGVTRVYWGESEDEEGNIVAEVNLEDAFGYEETKDLNGPDTFETFIEDLGLSPDEAADRTAQQGKEFDEERHKKKLKKVPKKIKDDPNFIDRLTLVEKKKIDEIRKEKMTKMVEDMLVKKSKDSDVNKKNQSLSKLLTKNLESIKKIAEKEGISISDLIKVLKKSE
jgi:hypothetical protein